MIYSQLYLQVYLCMPAVFWLYTAQRDAEESALGGEASTQRAERPEPLTS